MVCARVLLGWGEGAVEWRPVREGGWLTCVGFFLFFLLETQIVLPVRRALYSGCFLWPFLEVGGSPCQPRATLVFLENKVQSLGASCSLGALFPEDWSHAPTSLAYGTSLAFGYPSAVSPELGHFTCGRLGKFSG